MKKFYLLLILTAFLISNEAFAQPSGVQWKRLIGGDQTDRFNKIIPVHDGGYLLIGSRSVQHDLPNPFDSVFPAWDVWIVKTDKDGYVAWQETYGGYGMEEGVSAVETPDNGFMILAKTATFTDDGDVTGHHGMSVKYGSGNEYDDCWVLKVSSTGELEWSKTLGGSRRDDVENIIRTIDGNYMFSGRTKSWDGQLTGLRKNNLAPNPDSTTDTDMDGWVFKLDPTGNLLWQKCYGGNGNDAVSDIIEEPGGGVALVGFTGSTDVDLAGVNADVNVNAWFFRINNAGNILFSKTYGGSRSEDFSKVILYNGKYYAGGRTNSSDGDVIGYHGSSMANIGIFNPDSWLVELDQAGNIIRQQCAGTGGDEDMTDLLIDPEKGIFQLSLWYTGSAVDHYDFSFNLLSHANIGSEMHSIVENQEGAFYVVGTYSYYDDPIGVHFYGGYDGLLTQYGDVNVIKGRVFLDQNANGVQDPGERLMDNVKVLSRSNKDTTASLTRDGMFLNTVDTGTYLSSVITSAGYIVTPVSHNTVFTGYFNTDSLDFAIQPVPGRKELVAGILPLTAARPGFTATYQCKVYNTGAVTFDTVLLKLAKKQALSVVSSDKPYTVSGDTIYWKLQDIHSFDTITINVVMQLAAPPVINNGDTLKFLLSALPLDDVTPANNNDTLVQRVTGSYDPNDKTENHGGAITPEHVSGGTPLTYLIRFQNTGTDTAFNVTVRDTLESRLDWNSFEMIGASHPYQLTIDDNNKLTWNFPGINLADINVNEPASHGYIAYHIKSKSTVMAGDTIRNTAAIYFDFNLPVITNIQKTAVMSLVALPVDLVSFKAVLSDEVVNVNWKTATESNTDYFEIQRSSNGIDFSTIGTVKAKNTVLGSVYSFADERPSAGYNYYRLRIVDRNRSVKLSSVALVNVKADDIVTAIYPNPSGGQVMINIKGPVNSTVNMSVIDPGGRVVMTKVLSKHANASGLISLSLGRLPKGWYTLRFTTGSSTWFHRLVLQ